MAEDMQELFARVRGFEWNPEKRESNLRDHKIDFEDVKGIFDGYSLARRSDRHGEIRYEVFGYINGREVAVAFTIRGEICRIISARPASRKERREIYHRLPGRPPPRED
jgi:hypothetical protein